MNHTSSNPAVFYIVRHGETDGNVRRIIQGQKDFPLNDKGVDQAKIRAQVLKKVHFDLTFSSDLVRAHKTAQIIALEHDLIVTTTKVLRERNYGKFQGLSRDDFTDEINTLFATWYSLAGKEWLKHRIDDTVETGEEVVSRVFTLIREVAIGHPGKTILIVCHGGVMQNLLVHLGWAGQNELRRGAAIQNTAYFVLETDGSDMKVVSKEGIRKME
ncbi:MAG: histidine phosphatase family protein [Candidatus Roizmanbacteria bacterium]|nr:histidine phosphatase family protein [Candidatus Roizmanbacteria bacterium]